MHNKILIDGRPPTPLWFAPAALLLLSIPANLGVVSYPRGYFDFLALAVTSAAGVLAFLRLKMNMRDSWGWTFIALALLYNPAWPPHFDDAYWLLINLGAGASFILGGRRLSPSDSARTGADVSRPASHSAA